jgi:MYXO-CTERM domain-containing protein
MPRALRAGRSRFGAPAIAALVTLPWFFAAGAARAFCRTTTCGSEKSSDCAEPSRCPSGGAPLYWSDPRVSIGVENGSATRGISAETARDVLSKSMSAWTSVDCGGRPPSISFAPIEIETDAGGALGFGGDAGAGSTNSLRFFDTVWPHDPSAIALTTVRYGLESGRIVTADIEANAVDHELTVVDVGGDFDLQSVLTHEAGHFFGLAHVIERPATMFAAYAGGGNIDRRTLEDNDRRGICAAYPPNRFDGDSGCSCSLGGGGAARSFAWLPIAALALLRRRRARR